MDYKHWLFFKHTTHFTTAPCLMHRCACTVLSVSRNLPPCVRAWVLCVCVCVDIDAAPEAERSEVGELLRTVLAVEQADDLDEPLATRQQPQRAAATGDYLQRGEADRERKSGMCCDSAHAMAAVTGAAAAAKEAGGEKKKQKKRKRKAPRGAPAARRRRRNM